MARFDEHSRQIVVRIIYDGAATAGKTTNLEQLTHVLTRSRRGELIVPEISRGRTLFFDWLELQGGLIAGHRFRCELLSVPGQQVLRNRRLRLLQRADVVVLVVDSRPEGVAEAQAFLARFPGDIGRGEPVPLVVQANKQDLPGALGPEEVVKELGLRPEIPLVGALASGGAGVRDTALLAMRQAAVIVQEEVLHNGISALPRADETPESLYASMKVLRIEAGAADGPEKADEQPQGRKIREGAELPPPSPCANVPSRHIWPAAMGRDLIRSLPSEAPRLCPELMHKQGKNDGSGKPDTLIYRCGDYCLKTSPRRRYLASETAESALVDLARAKVMLGRLLMPSSVLVLQPDTEGAFWLWTVSPWTPSLRSEMATAEASRSSASLGRALVEYARASFAAMVLLKGHRLVLDINPSNFARHADGVGYTDDDICVGDHLPSLGYAWLKRIDEYASTYDAIEQYVSEIEGRILDEVSAADARALGLVEALDQTKVTSDAGREAKRRLLAASMRCR